MNKFLLSTAVFLSSAGYILSQYIGVGSTVTTPAPSTPAPTEQVVQTTPQATTPVVVQQPTPTPVKTPVSTPTPTPTPVVVPKGQYADGTYTGAAADAYYGYVQIRATVQGGKLTAVDFLQYPNDRRTSQQINSRAMPELKSEAIAAQSANVSGVSGATDTSQAFIQSLGDALAQAKNS